MGYQCATLFSIEFCWGEFGGCGGTRRRQDGSTVLIHAAANGHTDSVRLLLESGADMEAKNDVRIMHNVQSLFHLHEN